MAFNVDYSQASGKPRMGSILEAAVGEVNNGVATIKHQEQVREHC